MMKMSDKGLAFLACHEGMVLKAYKDVVGVWTIGIGHTKHAGPPIPKPGMRIREHNAMKLFMADIERYEKDVRDALGGVSVPQHVFDAMVSFHYNTGGIKRARFVRTIRETFSKGGDVKRGLELAGKQIMYWRKPRSILPRRMAERLLLVSGEYSETRKMLVIPEVTSDYKPRWSSAVTKDPYAMIQLLRAKESRAVAAKELPASEVPVEAPPEVQGPDSAGGMAWLWKAALIFAAGVLVGVLW